MASGDTLLEIPAANFNGDSTVTFDTRNDHPVADFAADSNKSAVYSAFMPQHYGSGGVTVTLGVSMTTAITGDTDWDCEIENMTGLDIDSDGFAAAQSTDNTTVPTTSGEMQKITISFTDGAQMDSVAAGDPFRIRVTRDSDSDTAAGDAELHWVIIDET